MGRNRQLEIKIKKWKCYQTILFLVHKKEETEKEKQIKEQKTRTLSNDPNCFIWRDFE